MFLAMMFTVSSAMNDIVAFNNRSIDSPEEIFPFNNESITPTLDIPRTPCSGVLECGKIIPNETEKHE